MYIRADVWERIGGGGGGGSIVQMISVQFRPVLALLFIYSRALRVIVPQ